MVLEPLHQGEGHKVARRQAVRRAVVADIKGGLAVVDEVFHLVLAGDLGHKPARHEFIVNCHVFFSFFRF